MLNQITENRKSNKESRELFVSGFKIFKLLLVLFLVLTINSVNAQEFGSVAGTIVDAQTGEELIGANVYLENTTIGAASNLEGKFEIRNVPAGVYNLSASMIGYAKLSITNVEVQPNQKLKLDISLKSEAYETEEVVVTAKLLLDNEAGLLKNRQKSTTISDAISSEQISRTGSSDAGDAIKKVVGSTVVDGKYVFVRGLGDRYSNTQLNGVELPSSDPNKKSFQLDLVPTNLLENIVTIKTFTPDKPGNFSGGIVDIGTKNFPERFTLKISGASSYNSQTSFNNNFITYNGGNNDWLGSDDGTREIPSSLLSTENKIPLKQQSRTNSENALLLDSYTKSFNNTMNVKRSSVPVNQSLAISFGDNYRFSETSNLGFLGSLTYGRNYSFYDNGTVGRYTVSDLNADNLNPQLLVNDIKGSAEANIGALITAAYNINSEQQIGGNIFYSRSGISTSRLQTGSWPQEFGNDPDAPVFYNQALSWVERDILNYQFRGMHFFSPLLNSTIDWNVSFSNTKQDEPDFRLLSYSIQQTNNGPNYIIVGSGFDDPSRYFRYLDENSTNYNLNLSVPFLQWNGLSGKFKFGGTYQNSDRTFTERIFAYDANNQIFNQVNGDLDKFFSDENLGIISTDTSGSTVRYTFGNVIKDNTRPRNNYKGSLEIFAGYGMIDIPLYRDLRFVGGARFETTDMSLTSLDTTVSQGKIDKQDILPSINLIYSLTDNMNIRVSGTQTLARPNFREIAPYSSKDFINDVELMGNPKLDRTLINNYDLRWEWFINPGEVFAVSGFYKDLKNPIELSYAEGAAASNPIVQYKNVDKATVAGVEFEIRFSLGQIIDELSSFYVGSNVSFIHSNIDISESELAQRLAIDSSSATTRVLQGQSPYVINFDLTYINDDWGTVAGLYFNTFGERLAKVSANINPDVYEQPAPMLNFTLSQDLIHNFKLNIGVKNLLNSTYKEVARYRDNDYTFYEYKSGINFSVGLAYGL